MDSEEKIIGSPVHYLMMMISTTAILLMNDRPGAEDAAEPGNIRATELKKCTKEAANLKSSVGGTAVLVEN